MSFFFTRTADAMQTAPGVSGDDSDEQLMAAAQSDGRAFASLYERYLNRIYRYCYNRLGSREAAEDATGEIFLKALAGLERYHGGIFAAWLYTIARNVITGYYRKNRPAEPWEGMERSDPEQRPEQAAETQEQWAALQTALAGLTEDQRAAVELPAAGWSDAQIANALGKSPAAVKMIRYRAMKRLQQHLSGK